MRPWPAEVVRVVGVGLGQYVFMSVFSARERPVEVPDDLDDSAPSSGRVRLPTDIAWSGQPDYDLDDPQQLRRVYEQVLREGTADEIRAYVRASTLLEVWEELFLPPQVRRAWEPWVNAHRGTRAWR